ncbi:MAG: hypothetical protein LQ352_000171 [Teloschistes flavicans]|nr:MAG: hypothetical protein LQ352_000171 [Teloschistes flavicans]
MAFDPKNLTYESSEPAFLRKLRGEYGASDTARHQRQQLRPRKKINADEKDEDEPVYVHDEDPHTPISKADYDAMMKVPTMEQRSAKKTEVVNNTQATDTTNTEVTAFATSGAVNEVHPRQELATIGGVLRKRAAKIIADSGSADEAHSSANRLRDVKRKSLKQGKKPKLSFQDD